MSSLKERETVNTMLFILEAVNEATDDDDTKKTTTNTIMYRALSNHPRLKQYWKVLIQNGLLSYDFDTETFKTTQKGLRFLKAYSQMDGMIYAPYLLLLIITATATRTTRTNLG
ncbi:MAG: winged helix-turn-helix domain-containing protein [Thermoproteota archaeon]|nr:winged helix-turn-helix domain-containing protein [Thermoproteota archaeon]